ncbi:proline-rich protein 23A3-like [Apodemus sylvaticus]|uniref:proline-rich protein 23A3-like n=1 Tax=Apodemus sylvaticus TaxID=10129 RepID=UPI002243BA42|nr:proline-rich protein 23A3-like [Apodemus sylvaticus]
MEGVRPHSTSADPVTNPAKRPRLQQDHPAQHALEGPMESSSDWLTSVAFLPPGSALQLNLDDCDLLLEPQHTSILEVSLPEHSILLVPEGLQDSTGPRHPEFLPSDQPDSDLLDMPREVIVIQPGSFSASVRDCKGLQNVSHSGMPWMKAPSGLVPELHLSSSSFQGQVPDGCIPSVSPRAEEYAPWAYWSPQGSILEFLPHSTLEPPPPSSPSSHQQQCPMNPVRPTRPPCKARKRLLFEGK